MDDSGDDDIDDDDDDISLHRTIVVALVRDDDHDLFDNKVPFNRRIDKIHGIHEWTGGVLW